MKRKVVMKDVAQAAGVSLMTVSYALRHHSCIPEATREKVLKAASDLGYTRSPLVSALVSHLRARREVKDAPLIAYVCSYSDRRTMMANPFRKAYFSGAEERAESQGYRLELFLTGDYSSYGGKRLSDVMRYRNVQGVIMGISPLNAVPVELEWSAFASCVIGYSRKYERLHRIDANNAQIVSLTLRKLKELGYCRIGMVVGSFEDRRVEGVITAAIAGYNFTHSDAERIPFCVFPQNRWTAKAISAWVKQHHFDALITESHTVYHYLKLSGFRIPEDLAVVTLECAPSSPLAGIDQRPKKVGAAAVDIIINQLAQNQRGLPSARRTYFIDGDWVDGITAPGR